MAFTPGEVVMEAVIDDVPFRWVARGRFVELWWKSNRPTRTIPRPQSTRRGEEQHTAPVGERRAEHHLSALVVVRS